MPDWDVSSDSDSDSDLDLESDEDESDASEDEDDASEDEDESDDQSGDLSDDESVSEDEDEGFEEEEGDDMPTDPDELRELVMQLRKQVRSLRNAANARGLHADHTRARVRKWIGPLTLEQAAVAARKHEERSAKFFVDALSKRSQCRAAIINRLGLLLSVEERAELRQKGLMQQEWFL